MQRLEKNFTEKNSLRIASSIFKFTKYVNFITIKKEIISCI